MESVQCKAELSSIDARPSRAEDTYVRGERTTTLPTFLACSCLGCSVFTMLWCCHREKRLHRAAKKSLDRVHLEVRVISRHLDDTFFSRLALSFRKKKINTPFLLDGDKDAQSCVHAALDWSARQVRVKEGANPTALGR